MGKKKRAIHRSKKFSSKYFQFLDNLDGTNDDSLQFSQIESEVKKVLVTDNGNQTISAQIMAIGPGDATGTAGLTGDKVKYKINGTLANATLSVAAGARTREDKFRFDTADPAIIDGGTGIVLDAGNHTLEAILCEEDGTQTSVTKKVNFAVERSVITMTPNANFLTAHTDGDNVGMDIREITATGKRPGELYTYHPGADAPGGPDGDAGTADHAHGYRISAELRTAATEELLADAAYAAVQLSGDEATLDAGDTHNNNTYAKLLHTDLDGAAGTWAEIKVTLTARSVGTAAAALLPDVMTDTIKLEMP
tara:strand:- start:1573 stop:2499 length:927 start_codon:yes stop_codon:yes gene_type:complete